MFLDRRRTASSDGIRVFLVAGSNYRTCSHGCNLEKLARQLNRVQDVYRFIVLPRDRGSYASREHGRHLNLRKRRDLRFDRVRAGAAKSLNERQRAVSTYIGVTDASEQAVEYVGQVLSATCEKTLGLDDLIVVIGGDVVVHDVESNEFEGDAEFDSYATASNIDPVLFDPGLLTEEGIEVNFVNELSTRMDNVGFISLRRITIVFPEIHFSDSPARVRAIVSRYITANIAGFVGNKTFAVGLSHDDMSGCLNESNWIGGERESYMAETYCTRCCLSYRRYGVLDRYAAHSYDAILRAIGRMCRFSDEADRIVKADDRISLWVNIGFVAVSLNLFDALVFDMSYVRFRDPIEWGGMSMPPHLPAFVFGVVVFLVGFYSICAYFRSQRQLP